MPWRNVESKEKNKSVLRSFQYDRGVLTEGYAQRREPTSVRKLPGGERTWWVLKDMWEFSSWRKGKGCLHEEVQRHESLRWHYDCGDIQALFHLLTHQVWSREWEESGWVWRHAKSLRGYAITRNWDFILKLIRNHWEVLCSRVTQLNLCFGKFILVTV